MRIVVRSQDIRVAREAQAKLATAGVEALVTGGLPTAAPDGEDVVIFCDTAASKAAAHAALTSGQPLAVLAGLTEKTPPPIGLSPLEPYAGAVALDAPPGLLAAQVAALIRNGVAEDEQRRRRLTAAAMDAPAPKPLEPKPLNALYIGAPSPKFLRLETTLAEHGGLVSAAFSSFAGFDHLHDQEFDAVVLNGARDPGTAISLCAALRRNASLYHLPTLMIVAPGDENTQRAAIERGAAAVAVINQSGNSSLGWLFEAVRRERRRKVIEHDIRALRDLMGDPRTGLFQRRPFEAHVARLAEDHHANGRPFALAVLRVMPAHGARTPSEEVWRKGFNEIASLAARLIRDADCGAALGPDLIALAMPASDLLGAKRTAERVASVSECTAFASGEGDAGPLVFEQSAVELQPGESGRALLARALRALEAESALA